MSFFFPSASNTSNTNTKTRDIVEALNKYNFNEENAWENMIGEKFPALNTDGGKKLPEEIASNLEELKKIFLKIGQANGQMGIDAIEKDLQTIGEVMRFADGLSKPNIFGLSFMGFGKTNPVFRPNVIQTFELILDAIHSGKPVEHLISVFNKGCTFWIDQKNADVKFAGDCLEILSLTIAQKLCNGIATLEIAQPIRSGPIKEVCKQNMLDTNTNSGVDSVLENALRNFHDGKYELKDMKNVIQVIESLYHLDRNNSIYCLGDLLVKLQVYKEIHDDICQLCQACAGDLRSLETLRAANEVKKQSMFRKEKIEKRFKQIQGSLYPGIIGQKTKEIEDLNKKIKEAEETIESIEKKKGGNVQKLIHYSGMLKERILHFTTMEESIKNLTGSDEFRKIVVENADTRGPSLNRACYILATYLNNYLDNSLSFTVKGGRKDFIKSVTATINQIDAYVGV